MWQIEETEDELTIKALPFTSWLIVLGAFIFGVYIFNFYVKEIGGLSKIFRLFEENYKDIVIVSVSLASFICGLCFFHFFPFTITNFNRQKQIVSHTTYSLLGKRTREFGYSYLQSGVQGFSETVKGAGHHWLFFYIEGGKRIKLSKESSWSKAGNLEVAAKANEYLKAKTEEKK